MSAKRSSGKDIPPRIVPARDEVVSRQQAGGSRSRPPAGSIDGGSDLLVRLFVVVSLIAAAVACVWVWQLQQKLHAAESMLDEYATRISDLEDRLSDTDEGMNQSAAIMSVKIKELYSEVDKLWASAWRKNKARLDRLEKTAEENFTRLDETDKGYSAQIKLLVSDINRLRKVAGDLQELSDNSQTHQELMERIGDDMSRATLEVAKLSQRVQAGEEWQGSVDGFRRQVNRNILELRKEMSRLQADKASSVETAAPRTVPVPVPKTAPRTVPPG